MNINLICVGNIKEDYLKDAISEYKMRLSKFATISIVEVKEEKLPKNFSDKDIDIVKHKETERLLTYAKGYTILLDVKGTELSSLELASKLKDIFNISSTINFVIGGSYGVSDELRDKADFKLSFSRLTFPHQLFRVNVLEQIYRAFTIINNITYHK